MKNTIMALTVSALVFTVSTANAVWGNSHTSTNGGYYNQNYSNQSWTDVQRDKHAIQNAYYVNQNGGTVDPSTGTVQTIVPTTPSAFTSTPSQWSNNTTTTTTGNSSVAGNAALLIQTARLATIERDMYGNTDGFILTLKGVEPNLAFFNNNGQRMIGKVAINDFINSMKSTNGASAALVTTSTTPDNAPDLQESVIILSNPVYDSRTQTLKFNIDNLNGNKLRAGSHQNPVLLIDSTFMNQ